MGCDTLWLNETVDMLPERHFRVFRNIRSD